MATDYFLKLEGIDGESEQKDHANEIELLSWSWGETNSGSAAGGGGQGSGKVDMQDFSFTTEEGRNFGNRRAGRLRSQDEHRFLRKRTVLRRCFTASLGALRNTS